jgi:hypothetical protein
MPYLKTFSSSSSLSVTARVGGGNALNMYLNPRVHGSIITKGKNSTRNGVKKMVRYNVEIAFYIRVGVGKKTKKIN